MDSKLLRINMPKHSFKAEKRPTIVPNQGCYDDWNIVESTIIILCRFLHMLVTSIFAKSGSHSTKTNGDVKKVKCQ